MSGQHWWITFVGAALLGAGGLPAGEPAELARMRDQYDRQARAALEPILRNYARDLENLSVRLSLQRDAEGAKQVVDETGKVRERLAALKDEPVFAPPRVAQKRTEENNVLANAGFEEGRPDGWYLFNTTAEDTKVERGEKIAHGGRHCLCLRRAPGPHDMAGALQDLGSRVQPGDRVSCVAWVRTPPECGPDKVLFAVALKEKTGDKIIQLISKSAKGNGQWEQLAFDFIVPSKAQQPNLGAIHLFVGIPGSKDIGDVLVDDVYAGTATE